jgi:transcriptional regulator with XRE-family HTH domain
MTKESGGRISQTAIRLRQLRRAEGHKVAKAFADRLGITASRLSNMEAGLPLSLDVARRIVAKVPGMSLDWLYDGREDALPLALRQRLRDAAAEKASTADRSTG